MIEPATVILSKHQPVTEPAIAVVLQQRLSVSRLSLYILLLVLAVFLSACTSETGDLPPGEAGISSGGVGAGVEDNDAEGDSAEESDCFEDLGVV